jgi:UDP-N-acetylmuramyl pentapeptide synthase
MQVLVLDTIHGGKEIGAAYGAAGHSVDVVDVYHGSTPHELRKAQHRHYDLVAAPVHLDPDHPLLASRTEPVITHHEAVRRLLGEYRPRPMIEITGARGKTTTAHALAHVLPGRGVLHTSSGTFGCPERDVLEKKSITPASVIAAARYAREMAGWLIAEISLGVTGAGDLAIITSPEDYLFARGKKHAIDAKIASTTHAKRVLVADGVSCDRDTVVRVSDIARCEGMNCTVGWEGMHYVLKNPLFLLPPYRTPLMLAAAAAMILHVNPTPLDHFTALPGRMSLCRENDLTIIDNANSGTNEETTLCAARYARHCAPGGDLTLVIGQVEGDGAVCEGFSFDQIASAIDKARPTRVVWVGRFPDRESDLHESLKGKVDAVCTTLEEGRDTAIRITQKGPVVLSVKTWR